MKKMFKHMHLKKNIDEFNMGSVLVFARLNFHTKIHHPYNDAQKMQEHRCKILLDVIKYETPIKKLLTEAKKKQHIPEGFDWHFVVSKSEKGYIYGKLGKDTKSYRLTPDDFKKDYVMTETIEAYIIYFLIDLVNNVMVYEVKKMVGNKAPIEILTDTFNAYHKDKEDLEINIIADKREIISRIQRLRKIEEIEFNVTPTNPHSTPCSGTMDEFLKSGNIGRLHLNAFAKGEGSIKLEDVPLLHSGFYLAQEGHGSGKARYKNEVVTTGDIPIKSNADLNTNEDTRIQTLLYHIKEMLKIIEHKESSDV
jgi:hypothetical protein